MARTWARSTYFKRLDDGRYEVGYIENGTKYVAMNTVADSISAFWWCWTH